GGLRAAAGEAARLRRREAGQRLPGAVDEQQTAAAVEEEERVAGALKGGLPAEVVGVRLALVHVRGAGGPPAWGVNAGEPPAPREEIARVTTTPPDTAPARSRRGSRQAAAPSAAPRAGSAPTGRSASRCRRG